jgi:Tannase and feruloyl esterase
MSHHEILMRHATRPGFLLSLCVIWFLGIVLGYDAANAVAQTITDPDAVAARCKDLNNHPFALNALRDAPTIISDAMVTRVDAVGVDVCMVDGYVSPDVGFRIALPLAKWNGKYLQTGCGGSCGTTQLYSCGTALKRGYACASADMGHTGNSLSWAWARENLQLMVDFGYRATHVTAITARAIAERVYGAKPRRSYFYGCSTGGRQGYLEAERFPQDFDGIVAGAPPLNETNTALQLAWSVLATQDGHGGYLLTEPDIRFLHSKVIEACDLNDGLKDGLIGDPRACSFDPASIACPASDRGQCLTDRQVEAVRKLYSGPVDAKGKPLGRLGGVMKGSELAWINDYVPGPKGPPQYDAFIRQFFQYMAFMPGAGPQWDFGDLDFERDFPRLAMAEMLYTANNPDLRNFRDRAGRLISFQGWGDTSVVPMQVIDYYELAARTMGGLARTQEFYRLFMVPGMRHCSSDGVGADTIDWLAMLDDWVEHGHAPDVAIGHARTTEAIARGPPVLPLDPHDIRLTRPHYPYPALTRYKGTGDPNDVANYERYLPITP